MRIQAGSFRAVAAAGAAALAVLACTPNSSGAGGGRSKDSGPSAASGNPLGAPCADSSQTAQSNCASGLQCIAFSDQNMCSEPCTQNATCGSNGTAPNICNSGACTLGCDPDAADPCERPDFVCSTGAGISNCVPDCTQQAAKSFCLSWAGYPFLTCDSTLGASTYGLCTVGRECYSDAGQPCPTGQVCMTPAEGSGTVNPACVPDCTQPTGMPCSNGAECPSGSCTGGLCDQCPSGYSCSATTSTCALQQLSYYGVCSVAAQCPENEDCVTFTQDSKGLCLQPCTQASDCPPSPPGSTCGNVTITSTSQNLCAIPCSSGSSTCPTGTTCQSLGNSDYVCLPG